MKKKLKIVLLGLGTVGFGVYELIRNNPFLNSQVEITKILVKNIEKKRNIDDLSLITSKIDELFIEPIDVMIETMGGLTPAYELTKKALSSGIHVITSNKELVNTYFYELLDLANAHQCSYLYEASVLAGIPIIKSLHHLVLTDEVISISGIFNGSTNYCLTRIFKDGYAFSDALNEAKKLGFLEADPKDDLEGFDALRKVMILAKIAYQIPILESLCSRRGIETLSDELISYVESFGYIIKLVSSSTLKNHELIIGVEPVLLKADHPYSIIDNEMNIIEIESKLNGKMTWTGKGAGQIPTAEGILSDFALIMNQQSYHLQNTPSSDLFQSLNQTPAVYFVEMKKNSIPKSIINHQDGLLCQTKKIKAEMLYPFLGDIKFYAKVV